MRVTQPRILPVTPNFYPYPYPRLWIRAQRVRSYFGKTEEGRFPPDSGGLKDSGSLVIHTIMAELTTVVTTLAGGFVIVGPCVSPSAAPAPCVGMGRAWSGPRRHYYHYIALAAATASPVYVIPVDLCDKPDHTRAASRSSHFFLFRWILIF